MTSYQIEFDKEAILSRRVKFEKMQSEVIHHQRIKAVFFNLFEFADPLER